ncbi:MAG: hypothetical protein J2P37_33715 [Ktedonobacteraceae bacterium]|nr:hypothetical protein [Ktedonobacteraceae bacterium]
MNDVITQSGLSRWGSPPEDPPQPPPDRPTFLMLMNWHNIDTRTLWRASGYRINPLFIEALKANIGMPLYLVEQLLTTFNQVTGQRYQVSDIRVKLMEGRR